MTLKGLAIRTKKSLSVLNMFSNEHPASIPETPKKVSATNLNENVSAMLGEFGQYRSPPSKTDSPSKRSRLMGSLRRMKSGFESPKSKALEEPVAYVERWSPGFVPPVQERPPLMLDFEASPSDEPMFGPQRNVSSTSTTDVHHSSPITVPGSARPSTPPNETTFPVGTVPDSPAPLTKMSEQESTLYHPSRNLDVLMISPSMADPNSTPMPGTNLTLEDTQTPGIVVTSCSPVVKRQEGYFAIPVVKVEDQAAPIDVLVDSQFTKQDVTVPQPDGVYDNLQAIKSTKGAVHCFDSYSITSDASARKSLERKSDCVAAYLALDGPSTVEKNQCAMERRRSTWSRQTGLYDGTGYASSGSHEDYRVNQVTVDDEQDAVLGFPLDQPPIGHQRAGPKTRVSEASADDKETLQEIIRAYAGYEDETPGEEMIELVMGKAELIMDKENMLPRDVAEQTVREAKLAIRIMNRSLGG